MIIKRDRVRIVDTCIQQWGNSYEAVPVAALRPLPTTSAAYTTAHELSYGDTQYIRGRPALAQMQRERVRSLGVEGSCRRRVEISRDRSREQEMAPEKSVHRRTLFLSF